MKNEGKIKRKGKKKLSNEIKLLSSDKIVENIRNNRKRIEDFF